LPASLSEEATFANLSSQLSSQRNLLSLNEDEFRTGPLRAKTEGLASELEEIVQELQQPRDQSPDPSHSPLDDFTYSLIQAKYFLETYKEYLESKTLKRHIKRLDDLTLSTQPPEKPSVAPLLPMPQFLTPTQNDGWLTIKLQKEQNNQQQGFAGGHPPNY
jgi:hypothetical protein